ncbi:MAG TPA: DUF4395 domain-containing protein [Nitriliruptorales bacterium]|nr:DUF4395 domain-containing protein [Nitriliruptorales bacterium]
MRWSTREIDVRGPRFSAAITMILLAVAIVVQDTVGLVLVAWQVLAFAVATVAGLRWSLYGNLFRFLKRRLGWGPPPATEPEGPPRFAQACGLVFAGAGLVAIVLGADLVGWVLVGIVLALSSLLALTGICVGCELYLLGERLRSRGVSSG